MRRWTGAVIAVWVVLFLAFDSTVKLLKLDVAVEGTTRLGYPADLVVIVGLVELACLLAYVIPRTAPIGALLLTGYLGGATATQVRVEDPWFLFPVAVGALIWGALWLRDPRVGALLFGTSQQAEHGVTPQLFGSVPRPS
jgi:DoxX-like family